MSICSYIEYVDSNIMSIKMVNHYKMGAIAIKIVFFYNKKQEPIYKIEGSCLFINTVQFLITPLHFKYFPS